MEEQGFYEVETPFLHPILGGANAKPFVTHFNALDRDYFLRIATELPLKRLLVGGFEKVFEIGRQFRNEGMDPYHNPEFTTMEAYQAFTDLDGMMELTEGYIKAAAMAACGTLQISYQGTDIDLSGTWPRKSMCELASEGAGTDVSFDRTREGSSPSSRPTAATPRTHGAAASSSPRSSRPSPRRRSSSRRSSSTTRSRFPLWRRRRPTTRSSRSASSCSSWGMSTPTPSPSSTIPSTRPSVSAPRSRRRAWATTRPWASTPTTSALSSTACRPQAASASASIVWSCCSPTPRRSATCCSSRICATSLRSGVGIQPAPAASEVVEPAADVYAPNKVPTLDYSKVAVEPLFADEVDFDTFSKSDFRTVKVKDCVAVPKSKKLLQFTLDDGTGEDRTILSGIHANYEPEDLIGRTLIAITNLPPRKMMGVYSCGMIISAIHEEDGEERLNVLMVDDRIPAGAKLY